MKKLFLFAAAIVFLFSVTVNSQVKHVLLEQYTGAWCGWCVDGTVKMDEIIKAHPDRVIGIKLHSGDKMQIPVTPKIISGLEVSGFPSGSIDRKKFGKTIPQNRGLWKTFCEAQLAQKPDVDITVKYNINKETRQLMVKVFAKMLNDVDKVLKLNAIVIEDSVSGKGQGWDQHNYFSNNAHFKEHPYYDKPSTIVGYQHMKVVRNYLGGAWGEQGNFEKPAKKNKVYYQDFNLHIPDNWKFKDLHIIGLAQVYDNGNKEILNCNYASKTKASISLYSKEQKIGLGGTNAPFKRKFTFKNISSETKTFVISTSTSKRTPADWKFTIPEFNKNEVTLEAGKSVDFTLTMEPGNTVGIGDGKVIIEEKGKPNVLKGIGKITTYSSKIKKIEILIGDANRYPVTPLLKETGKTDFFQLTAEDYAPVANLLDKKTLIWNTGVLGGLSGRNIANIKEAIDSKIPVFICGNRVIRALSGYKLSGNYLGFVYNSVSKEGYGTAPWQVWFSGVAKDLISGPLGNSIEGNLIKLLIQLIKITDNNKCTPFIHFKNDGKRVIYVNGKETEVDIKAEDAIFGAKVDNGQSRIAVLGITPYVLKDNKIRKTLVDRIVRWINHDKTLPVEENTGNDNEFTVAPIPARDNITFNFGTAMNSTIRIYNSMGMLVDEINDLNTGNRYSYNTSSLSSGVYTAIWNNGNAQQTAKFSIVK